MRGRRIQSIMWKRLSKPGYLFVVFGLVGDDCPHVVAARQLEGGDHLRSDAPLRDRSETTPCPRGPAWCPQERNKRNVKRRTNRSGWGVS